MAFTRRYPPFRSLTQCRKKATIDADYRMVKTASAAYALKVCKLSTKGSSDEIIERQHGAIVVATA